jgi:hypothetical protein
MPIVYRLVPSLGCTVAVWDGAVTAEEVHTHLVRLAADPCWPPGDFSFTDMSSIQAVTIPDPELVELLFEATDLANRLKVAVLLPDGSSSPPPSVEYGTASESLPVMTFGDFASACAFLGVPDEAIRVTICGLRQQLASGEEWLQ